MAFAPVFESRGSGDGVIVANSYPGARLLIGTSYGVMNGKAVHGIVRLQADGVLDPGFLIPGNVKVLAVYPDGRVLFGETSTTGFFTFTVHRILADGSPDPTFSPLVLNDNAVQAVFLNDERVLLLGPYFTTAGGVSRRGMVLLETNGALSPNFVSPFPSNYAPVVTAVPTVDAQHIIIAGANLNLGTGSNSIARLNNDGSVDLTFNASSVSFSSILGRVYPAADGSMLVTNSNSGGLMRLNANGTRDDSFAPAIIGSSPSFGGQQSDGKIFYISTINTSPNRRELHRMNADGSNDTTFPVIATTSSSDYALSRPILADDGTFFQPAMTAERRSSHVELTHVLTDGTIDPNFNPRFSRFAEIEAYGRQTDGRHLAAGSFYSVTGHLISENDSLVRLNDAGEIDLTFSATLAAGSHVSKIEPQPDGKVLIFGSFPVGGGNYESVRRHNSDGSIDSSFQAIPQGSGEFAVSSSGLIYCQMSDAGGVRLKRYLANGQIDPTFQSGYLTDFAASITPLPDGAVLLAEISGVSNVRLTRLLPDGSRDPEFVTRSINSVVGLLALPDGKALLCERLSVLVTPSPNFQTVAYPLGLRRIAADGSTDFEYITEYTSNEEASDEIQMAVAGVLVELRGAPPTNQIWSAADFRTGFLGMLVDDRSAGDLVLLRYGSVLERFVPLSPANKNYPTEPKVLGLQALSTSLRPLNSSLNTSMTVGGLAPFTYQWLKNNVPIAGKTSANLGLQGIQAVDAGDYSVVVTNGYGSATSSPFTMTVDTEHTAPLIITHPTNHVSALGGSVTFSVVATANPAPTYQWIFNGSNIVGATSPTLFVNKVQAENIGTYRVNIRNTVVNAAGSFGSSVNSETVTLTISTPPAADFNGDGKADILWRNKTTGEVGTWLMNGTNVASYIRIGSVGAELKVAGTGDFNGDGKPDILWRNKTTGEVGAWLMNGTSVSSYVTIGTRSSDWLVAGTGDFNGDGKRDILWRNRSTGEVGTWLMNGAAIVSYVVIGTAGLELTLAGTGDFNGDGKIDLLWRNSSNGDVITWLMNGTAISSTVKIGSVGSGLIIAGTGDFNADGKTDILWRNSTTGEVGSWLLNGTTVSSYVTLGFAGLELVVSGSGEPIPEPSAQAIPDFNGDAKADIIWRNTTTGEVGVWLMNGTSVSGYVTIGHVGPPWTIVALGDLNADGRTDIVWRDPTTGDVGAWLMNGTAVTSYQAIGSVAAPWSVVGLGDFNADGKPDLVWRNSTTGDVGTWLMNGTTVTSYQLLGSVGSPWTVAGVGDFNGDGKPDILWRDTSTGDVGTWLMNGTTISSYQAIGSVGSPWTIAGVTDLNGDGKPDVLWRNPSNGDLGIWTLNNTTVTGFIYIGSVGPPWTPID